MCVFQSLKLPINSGDSPELSPFRKYSPLCNCSSTVKIEIPKNVTKFDMYKKEVPIIHIRMRVEICQA